ncbi:hypothetical protein N9933_02670, partial [bacterium]|nr:hypothetical protein [bacterium]
TSSSQSKNSPETIQKFWRFGASLENADESDFEESRTYIKGLRSMYGYFRQNGMGIKAMQAISPVPIFISGPHGTGDGLEINLTSNSFGHYNIEFFKWAQDHLIPGASDEKFRSLTQSIYTDYLGDLARVYYDAYYFLKKTDASRVQEAKSSYLASIEALKGTPNTLEFSAGPGSEIYMLFDYAYAHDTSGFHEVDYVEYNAFVAPGFWIRRDLDGTDTEAFKLLEKMLLAYDADFVKDIKKYYGK